MPEHAFDFTVEGPLLTDVGGTLPNPVLSTPRMVAMMERAATICAAQELPEGGFTVGFEICVKHVAAAQAGSKCTARSRLNEVLEGRKLRFAVEVVAEDGRTIGVGTHERRIVSAGG